jgi:hypothetical protein
LAATVTDRPLLFGFDGSDTTAGAFQQIRAMTVDQSSGSVYVLDAKRDVVDKLSANGAAANFSATGTSSLDGSDTPQGTLDLGEENAVAVDSSGVNPGRIYVASASGIFNGTERTGGRVNAYSPSGEYLWQLAPGTVHPCGVAVDAEGHLWIGDPEAGAVREFANVGSPPAEIGSFVPQGSPCKLGLSASGDVYLMEEEGGPFRIDKYVAGSFDSTLDAESVHDVAVDQSSSSGHVFTLHQENFNEYDAAGALVGSFATNSVFEAQGIGYNPGLDRVYVAQLSGSVKAFGPVATGTVPDPTIEAPTAAISKAKFAGTINPQGVPNSYYFEWKVGTGANWEGAKTSPPQALPEDSLEHPVSFDATGLAGNTTYEVRLVGENTENGLRAWSGAETFSTEAAAAGPVVTISDPASVTSTSAEVSGTVNSEEDFGTTWQLETSTDPLCESGFSSGPEHALESEAASPVPVSEALTGLLPSQHYCVRISAVNSFEETHSEAKEFETDAVAPAQAFTAFAAPRADTTARLNARINPEGEALTYRFEYSADAGATWIQLPDLEDTSEARKQIVVAEQLQNLTPATTYSYRFSAENPADAGSPLQGGEKTFTTRTSAEMQLPRRGVELVNNPDKGNQHVVLRQFSSGDGSLITSDGEKLVWTVLGGAPGGPSGTFSTFLATRSTSGWHSRALVPPAQEQVGDGRLKYLAEFASPDFTHFIFRTEEPGLPGFGQPPSTYIRLDDNQHQEVLAHFDINSFSTQVDVSADTAHVLHTGEDTEVLEDIGSGTPEVVGLLANELPPPCGIHFGTEFAGSQNSAYAFPGYHWIASTDASRVFFQTKGGASCNGPEGLYVRNRDAGVTTQIAQSAAFIRATADGRSAFFTTTEALAAGDTNPDRDVYEWTEGAGATCLTCVVPDANVTSQNGNVRVSDDFSHVYFQSTGQLVPGLGRQGDLNLYVLSGGSIRFVADPDDPLTLSSMEMSTDGNVLVFLAGERLTADRIGLSCTNNAEATPHPCRELYRYDDRDGALECVSCVPEGTTTRDVLTENTASGQAFGIAADGSTVAFVTAEPLLRSDINGGADVYQWRSGAIGLVTDGETEFPDGGAAPSVAGVDADGSDVFFQVADPGLTGFEHDGVDNVYDARIGGGFEPPPAAVHCSEESCQGPLQAAPLAEQPASSGSGRGNVKQARRPRHPCARKHGKARKRCAQHKPHRHRAEKSAKTRGAK